MKGIAAFLVITQLVLLGTMSLVTAEGSADASKSLRGVEDQYASKSHAKHDLFQKNGDNPDAEDRYHRGLGGETVAAMDLAPAPVALVAPAAPAPVTPTTTN